ncbi:MAG: 50S ribosomal protein L11 methyltransferase [Desulfobacteraceae bacterium]
MASDAFIKKTALSLLSKDHIRLTPLDLERTIRCKIPSARQNEIRQAVRELVTQGRIIYSQHNATTHLELNYHRPVQISRRLVLSPPQYELPPLQKGLAIKLAGGTAFGGGDHPTTRMILRGLDLVLERQSALSSDRALDIGTGTGVLAIAAAVLGFVRVDAVDIDPAACYEAKQNTMLNSVEQCVHISQNPIDPLSTVRYDLILANLRPPTIIELIPVMMALSASRSLWIISGCRVNEGWSAFAVYGDQGDDNA